MNRLLSLTFLLVLTGAQAQTAQDIVTKVDAAQKTAKDVSFRLAGTAGFESGTQKIDLTVKSIPSQNLARIQFAAPDALADNIMVTSHQEVRQYMFLTNQITVTSADKASAGAGLSGIDFTQFGNTSSLLSQYSVKLLGASGSVGNRVFELEAANKGSGGDKARVWITEAGWRPNRLQLMDRTGKVSADLTISNYKIDSGLTAAGLKALPKDAQIIKQ